MRSVVIHGPKDLRIEDRDADRPGPGQVAVTLAAGGICGSDLHYYNHGGFGTVRLREPMILGHEVSGHVSALGDGVTDLALGDLVAVSPSRPCGACGYCLRGLPNHCENMRFYGSAMPFPHIQGAFREVLVADAVQCVKADSLSAGEAAMAEPFSVALQRAGTAAAFRDPVVRGAIARTPGGIAVSIVQWSSIGQQAIALDWQALADPASTQAFAEAVDSMPRRLPGGGTRIHAGLAFAARMFETAPGSARRRLIDLSGNGRADDLKTTHAERDRLAAAGIGINALAIEEDDAHLTGYFHENLITGPHAFVVTANDFEDFAVAMRAKLLREITGPTVASVGMDPH